MLWVQFKDNNTLEYDLSISKLGMRQRAEENIDEYVIPYRNDNLIIHSNTYKPYLRPMEFVLRNSNMIPLINQWLTGRGKLRTSVDVGGYFVASVTSALGIEKLSRLFNGFTVTFKVNPFFYLDSGDEAITISTAGSLHNPGTVYSEPYIKITGSGNIDLAINDKIVSFSNIDSYIEVDSELQISYKDTLNQGEKMIGEFPIFEIGENNISWTGNVSNIEIIPKWREL